MRAVPSLEISDAISVTKTFFSIEEAEKIRIRATPPWKSATA